MALFFNTGGKFVGNLNSLHLETIFVITQICLRYKKKEPYCWGINNNGQCGVDFNQTTRVSTPKRVEYELKDVKIVGIRIGESHTGCITKNGDYYLWGGNEWNEC